ncbi:MAG: DUF547 domain-containing protein [Alphaproteobacteria bacterium]
MTANVRQTLGICCLLLAVLGGAPARAAPDAELWARWVGHDPASALQVDHGAWDVLIARYRSVGNDGIARFRYGAVTAEDRAALDAYLSALAATPVSRLRRDQQRAFWINLYNALTVRVVLDHYPLSSIRDIDISPGLFSDGPWGAQLIAVDGEPLTLDDIEHRILRPIWRDPRLHYAVNCASLSCPDLPPEAMRADTADRLLDAAARAYVNHPRAVAFDAEGRLVVSSIYAWYGSDFGDGDAAIIAHLRAYAEPALAARLAAVTSIADHDYDWRLNDASPP